MASLAIRGSEQLRAAARSLKAAGSPGKGIRSKMRRNIVAAVKPMKTAVQSNARSIPAHGPDHTGLRAALARATQVRIRASGSSALVRLWVNPDRMPAGQRTLPALMEGERRWRHPVHGTDVWVDQSSHPFFAPAVTPRLIGVQRAVIAAAEETVAEIERGF